MNRDVATLLVVGGIVLVAALALLFGLGGVRTTTGVARIDPPDTVPASGAVVFALSVDEGISILGVRLRPSTYRVRVQFLVAGECLAHLKNEAAWPLDEPACASDVPIEGTVTGRGRTGTGETIVGVEREISEQCFDALDAVSGGPWPPAAEACTR